MRVLIIVPAYNEAENIERVVDDLREHYPWYDYLVVTDGSRDATPAICRARGYNLLELPVNLGLAGAVQAGLQYAVEREYDAAVQLDGDGQHDPAYIEPMLERMEQSGADIVIGSRFKEEKKPGGLRMLGSNMIGAAIHLTTGKRICDPTSGMRLLNRKMIREFAGNLNYGPEPDTVAYLLRNGARVEEVQVTMRERTAGESYLNLSRAAEYMFRICFSIVFIQWFRRRKEI